MRTKHILALAFLVITSNFFFSCSKSGDGAIYDEQGELNLTEKDLETSDGFYYKSFLGDKYFELANGQNSNDFLDESKTPKIRLYTDNTGFLILPYKNSDGKVDTQFYYGTYRIDGNSIIFENLTTRDNDEVVIKTLRLFNVKLIRSGSRENAIKTLEFEFDSPFLETGVKVKSSNKK